MESTWHRCVKRKLEPIAGGDSRGPHRVPQTAASGDDVAARVEVENEVSALRETLARQQHTIQGLTLELEEEQNSASTAASETMSMILRLQREKAVVQMEYIQFKRLAEEKMAHDQQELVELDDLLFKHENAVHSLVSETKAYNKHLLPSYGIDARDAELQTPQNLDLPNYEYPPLMCTIPGDVYVDDWENSVLEKYTPTSLDHLQNLDSRIYEMEVENKEAVAPHSGLVRNLEDEFKDEETRDDVEDKFSGSEDNCLDDDDSTRVYTIDAVHAVHTARVSNEDAEYGDSARGHGSEDKRVDIVEDGDIKKLYMRLQALEADRESMRQAIISMGMEKAQLVLLKEIAQQLSKEASPNRTVVKKPSLVANFSFSAVIKWVLSFIFWRKKASRAKYSFGLSNNNVGLLLLLDKSPCVNKWRCLKITRG